MEINHCSRANAFNEQIQEKFRRHRKMIYGFVDDLNIRGAENVPIYEKIHEEQSPILYVGNHQTALDYIIPNWAILETGMPYPRAITGHNLNHLVFKKFMWDFEEWGVIWHDRHDQKKFRKYIHELKDSFSDGISVLVFPEGTRSREIRGEPLEFKEGFFRIIIGINDQLISKDKPELKVVCFACDYNGRIPEEGYYSRIDRKKFSVESYLWDLFAFKRWQYFEKDKGTPVINFSSSMSVESLTEGLNHKEGARNFASNSRKVVVDLLRDIR